MRQNRAIITLGDKPTDAELLAVGNLQKIGELQNTLYLHRLGESLSSTNSNITHIRTQEIIEELRKHVRGMCAATGADTIFAEEKLVDVNVREDRISVYYGDFCRHLDNTIASALKTTIGDKQAEIIPAGRNLNRTEGALRKPRAKALLNTNQDNITILHIDESHSARGEELEPVQCGRHNITVLGIHPDGLFTHLMHHMELDQPLPQKGRGK